MKSYQWILGFVLFTLSANAFAESNTGVPAHEALQVSSFRKLDPILSKQYNNGQLQIVGAVYDLETGEVSFLDEKYISSITK
ncbi:hypothetical protein JWG40_10940 [Leptospira sp. 201903074]|uniref:hypothetical protein n=1 Tax=Leptospira abararensis TaxID=2810036 RepID=UPI001962BE65|nr:hypothetical protein [Leptospira abararensis]MBM9547533.1 hypothetical protein [Leptospira abararensis]